MASCHCESAYLIRCWLTLAQWVLCLMFHYIPKDFPCHPAVDTDNKSSAFLKTILNYLQIFLEPLRSVGTRIWVKIQIYFHVFSLNRCTFCLFPESQWEWYNSEITEKVKKVVKRLPQNLQNIVEGKTPSL